MKLGHNLHQELLRKFMNVIFPRMSKLQINCKCVHTLINYAHTQMYHFMYFIHIQTHTHCVHHSV